MNESSPGDSVAEERPISVEVAGVKVEGRIVLLLPRAIVVEIKRPFQGPTLSTSIPLLGVDISKLLFARDGRISPSGEWLARSFLRSLYLDGCLAEQAGDQIRAKIQQLALERPREPEALTEEAFRELRRHARQRFRSGELGQYPYHLELKALRSRRVTGRSEESWLEWQLTEWLTDTFGRNIRGKTILFYLGLGLDGSPMPSAEKGGDAKRRMT